MPRNARRPRSGTRARREQILAVAAELFAERGFAATGMDEVGEAAGITGGALYRHFDSKLDLFQAVVEPMAERRIHQMAEIVAGGGTPERVLDLLVDNLLDAILEDRSISAAMWRELRHLDVAGEGWFDRIHALNTGQFVTTLRELRPELTKREAEVRTQAAFGLFFSSVEFERPLPREVLKRLLSRAALDVLLC